MITGIGLIENERMRQVLGEGWTAKHDDQHKDGELALAAAAYAVHATKLGDPAPPGYSYGVPPIWPWSDADWKPSDDPVRNLIKAGALIAAEIDRLERLKV